MSTVLLRNVNPLGQVDVPALQRQGEPLGTEGSGCLEPGEIFEVDAKLGKALLEQVGNYEPAPASAAFREQFDGPSKTTSKKG